MRTLFTFVVLAAAFMAGCAKSIPEKEGAYLRSGREWAPLPETPLAPFEKRSPVELKTLEAVPRIAATDSPRLVFVGSMPQKLTALKRKGDVWEPVNVAAAPHEDRKGVWEVAFPSPAPQGLTLVRFDDRPSGIAFVNGVDPRFHRALGIARKNAGDLPGARAILEQAVDGAPKDAALKNELARVLAAQKTDLGEAKSLANDAISLAADDKERALYFDTLGEVYFADGDADKGIEAIERAISLDLQNPDFHRHLVALLEAVQEEPPEAVLRKFYDLLGRGEYGDASDLASTFDVERHDDAGTLKSTLEDMARGGPFASVEILSTIKHGKVTRFKYSLIGQDGSRRNEDIQLQIEDHRWTVSLP